MHPSSFSSEHKAMVCAQPWSVIAHQTPLVYTCFQESGKRMQETFGCGILTPHPDLCLHACGVGCSEWQCIDFDIIVSDMVWNPRQLANVKHTSKDIDAGESMYPHRQLTSINRVGTFCWHVHGFGMLWLLIHYCKMLSTHERYHQILHLWDFKMIFNFRPFTRTPACHLTPTLI